MNPQDTQFVYRAILFIIFIASIAMITMNYYSEQKIKAIHQETQNKMNIEKQKQLQILLRLKDVKATT